MSNDKPRDEPRPPELAESSDRFPSRDATPPPVATPDGPTRASSKPETSTAPDLANPAPGTKLSGDPDQSSSHLGFHLFRRWPGPIRQPSAVAQELQRRGAAEDPGDNADTRLPSDEQALIPVIWLAEVFTPTTLPSLLSGVRELTSRASERWSHKHDAIEWIITTRRRGGGGQLRLPFVRKGNGPSILLSEIYDQTPPGIDTIYLSLHTLTSTVTVLTAQFHLNDDRARKLEEILNQDLATGIELPQHGGFSILRVKEQKANAVEAWRTALRQDATSWLAEHFPGSFHRSALGQLPTIELMLTRQYRPFEPPCESGWPGWADILDLGDLGGYWQCIPIRSLRLRERAESGLRTAQRHRLVLAAIEKELVADYDKSLEKAVYMLDGLIRTLLARWSLTALIRELEEQLASIQDVAEQASFRHSPRALTETQRQLLRTGIDSRIVVNDIIRYAQNSSWGTDVLEFSEVPQRALSQNSEPPTSLTEWLQLGQITGGERVARLETDLRDILSTSAGLISASENLRLQRRVVWLTVISVLAAVVGAAAAVLALRASAGQAPTPHVQISYSPAHASTSPRQSSPAG